MLLGQVPWLNLGLSSNSLDDGFVLKTDPSLSLSIPSPFTALPWALFPKHRPNHITTLVKEKKKSYNELAPQTLHLTLKSFHTHSRHNSNSGSFHLHRQFQSTSGKCLFHSRPGSPVTLLAAPCPAGCQCALFQHLVSWDGCVYLPPRPLDFQLLEDEDCSLPILVFQVIITETGVD